MFVTTKIPLAEWLEARAARAEHQASKFEDVPSLHAHLSSECARLRAAAFALRRLTPEQEADMLEFQVGGPDGSGDESTENPITVVRPAVVLPDASYRTPVWYVIRDRLVESLRASGR